MLATEERLETLPPSPRQLRPRHRMWKLHSAASNRLEQQRWTAKCNLGDYDPA